MVSERRAGQKRKGNLPREGEKPFPACSPPPHPTASHYQPTKPHAAGAGRLEILLQTATQKEIIRTFEGKHRESNI